jgi:3-hydroxyisobutyrate dehydrogenase-like beta-hydroxyacid dehydrogenase
MRGIGGPDVIVTMLPKAATCGGLCRQLVARCAPVRSCCDCSTIDVETTARPRRQAEAKGFPCSIVRLRGPRGAALRA